MYEIPRYLLEREAAKRADRVIQLACGVLAVLCLTGAVLLIPSINSARTRYQLVLDPETVKGLPPDIQLLTKTGTLRALAIDTGFIRLERLKSEGKYYELMQLSSWLCKLAPRYPSVWTFAAWNQAYNISVTQYLPEARWKWVSNGLHLLRDEGIQYNPRAINLYKELSWIYWHKIGDFTDDHHWSYKKELAVEVERVLGPPPIALTAQETIDAFRKIADAPRDLEAFLREDAKVAAFVAKLREVGLQADETLLEFVGRYFRNDLEVASLMKIDENDAQQRRLLQRTKLLADPRNVEVRDRLLAALRAHVLRTRFHMDPQYMLELMEQYGPLDWRLPYGMGLYWANLGDKITKESVSLDPSESMNTVRQIFFCLRDMARRGRLVLEPNFERPNASYLQLLPDHRFIRKTHEAFLKFGMEQMMNDPKLAALDDYPILVNFRTGHVNMLREGIRQLWWVGTSEARAEALEYYQWLREHDREPNGDVKTYYLQPIEVAVMADIYDGLTSFNNAQVIVGNFLYQSFDQLAIGDLARAQGFLNVARQGWEHYMADKKIDIVDRRLMPPWEVMRRKVAIDYLQRPDVPPLKKVRVWRNLDLETRRYGYDELLPYMTRLCAEHEPPLNLDEVFREPPGMEEFRKQMQQTPESTEPPIEAGEKAPT
ncbi:MAG: hypothetical protein V2A79_17495 [Planctomycetota bacterium]